MKKFSNFLEDTKWLLKLAYLASIYQHLNRLNASMQGPGENILPSSDKLLAFKNKIQVWKKHISSGNIEMFPLLLQIQDQSYYKGVIPLIISHLESLTDGIDQYLRSLSSEICDWVRKSFVGFSQYSLGMREEEQVTESQCSRTLKMKFIDVLDFTRKEYLMISAKAVKILLQFSTSRLCEQSFSRLTDIRSKDRNRLLSVEEELRVYLLKIRPKI
jgi:hypothetical protein